MRITMDATRTLLIAGGHVATMDADDTIHAGGYVLIRGGLVESIGPAQDTPQHADERIDATGCLVIPGLINTHQHLWYNLMKCISDGMLLEPRGRMLKLPATAALQLGDLECSAYLSGLEMLSSGTTTFLNHSVTTTGEAEVEAQIRPTAELGLRQVFAKELRPYPSVADSVALAEQTHRTWEGAYGGRVNVGLVVESTAHWIANGSSSEEMILAGKDLADRLDLRISAHLAGGTMSREQGYLKYVIETGRTEVEYLQRIGVLDERWVLAHVINATPRDIELLAKSGATVSHTPTAEASRGGGITPVRQMLAAGVNVHLGTDGPNVDTTVDMVEQMKITILLQNQLASARAVDAIRTLRMSTIDAARALGIADRVGSLEPGKVADVAIFDMSEPHTAVSHEPLSVFVHAMRGRDVRDLIIDGQIVIRDRGFVKIGDDAVASILDEATGRAQALLERAHLSNPRWNPSASEGALVDA
ncbi:MAG: amidohydrolase family protein [Microbacterium sp.]